MTFQVQVKCLICRKLTDPTINSVKETNAKALNLLHTKLCLALKLHRSPEFQQWDFTEEPFPYCESCGQRLQRLGELIDQLKSIEEEISGSLATVSALVITSDKSDTDTSDDPLLVTPKLGQMKEYFKSRRLQEKHDYFRSLIIKRLNPRVSIERCDSNCVNNPGLSAEQYDYELRPKPILLKTEPIIEEGFPDTAEEDEETFNETEYKVEASSNTISGAVDEPNNEIPSSLPPVPTLTFLIIAPVKGEMPITTLPTGKGNLWSPQRVNQVVTGRQMKQTKKEKKKEYDRLRRLKVIPKKVPTQRHFIRYDESTKTGEINGFKFKELENGSYECSTCGFVSTRPRRNGRCFEKVNIRQHIYSKHLASRACKECDKVFPSSQTLYDHCLKAHRAPKFQCGLCGEKFPLRCKLKKHVLRSHEQGERPYACDECGLTFFKKLYLETHSRMHMRKKAIGVDVKKATTTAEPCLDDPVRTNRMGVPRVCVDCGKVFSSVQTLSKHRAMAHDGSKKLQCDYCGEIFPFEHLLKVHVLRHTGERPYSCEDCGKCFMRKQCLRSHFLGVHSRNEAANRDSVESPAMPPRFKELS